MKRAIKETIETANLAYLERDKCFHQIDEINKLSQKESQEFDGEYKELIETSKKNLPDMDKTARTEVEKRPETPSIQGFATKKDSKIKKNNIDHKSEQAIYKELRAYELDYHKLIVATGINDFQELDIKFKEIEEKNFRQYRYINELSQQIEDLEKYNKELMIEKENLENIEENTNLKRKDYLINKNDEMDGIDDRVKEIKDKNNQYDSQIKEAINELENLFYYLNCDKQLNKYTDDNPFAYGNLKSTLGLIENQQDQLLYLYNLIIQSKNADHEDLTKKKKKKSDDVKIKKIGDLLQNGKLNRRYRSLSAA